MASKTFGIIETEGLLDAFLAGDAVIKGSNVEITGRYLLGGGLVTLVISGPPAAVKSAIDIVNRDPTSRNVRTVVLPNLSKRVRDIMLSSGGNGASGPSQPAARKNDGLFTPRPEPVPKAVENVPSIFDTSIGTGEHLKQTFKKRQTRERSEKEVKKRQALIIQYLVANRNRKIAISDMEKVIPDASKVTLRRDLNELIEVGKIVKKERGRATHYTIA